MSTHAVSTCSLPHSLALGLVMAPGLPFPSFAVPGLSTGRFAARQQRFRLLGIVDQELPGATGQHVLRVLDAPMTSAGRQGLASNLLHTLCYA